MAGDKLTILLFLIGTGVAGVMGALSTVAWKSKVLWAIGLVCFVFAIAYWRFATSDFAVLAWRTIWSFIPLVAVSMCMLVVGDREPRPPTTKTPFISPSINAALTADYFYGIVRSGTELEAQRKLGEFRDQLAKMKARVVNISDRYLYIEVRVLGLSPVQGENKYNTVDMRFRKNQANALSVIKPEDWIEFTGRVEQRGGGWRLTDCEFVGRADAPTKPRVSRAKKAP